MRASQSTGARKPRAKSSWTRSSWTRSSGPKPPECTPSSSEPSSRKPGRREGPPRLRCWAGLGAGAWRGSRRRHRPGRPPAAFRLGGARRLPDWAPGVALGLRGSSCESVLGGGARHALESSLEAWSRARRLWTCAIGTPRRNPMKSRVGTIKNYHELLSRALPPPPRPPRPAQEHDCAPHSDAEVAPSRRARPRAACALKRPHSRRPPPPYVGVLPSSSSRAGAPLATGATE